MNGVVMALPRVLVLSFATTMWVYGVILLFCTMLRVYIVLYAYKAAGFLDPLLTYVLFSCATLLFFAGACRLFELEYFRRIEYQVQLCFFIFYHGITALMKMKPLQLIDSELE